MFGSAGPLGSDPGNNVEGYTLAIEDGPPIRSVVTNATTGALLIQSQFEAPTNVAASQSGSSVVVTWTDNAGGAAAFVYIERSADGSTWTEIDSATGENETYTDSDPGNGTWYYRLRSGAGENTGRSPYSNTASVTVVPVTTPVLTVTPTSGTLPFNVTISWTSVAGQSLYRFQVADDVNFNTIVIDDTSAGTSLGTVPYGAAGTTYWRVRGDTTPTPWSNTVTVTVIP